jgi:hypothetical protein
MSSYSACLGSIGFKYGQAGAGGGKNYYAVGFDLDPNDLFCGPNAGSS